jgi:hypothetical protein
MPRTWQPTEAGEFARWAAQHPRATVFTVPASSQGAPTYSAHTPETRRSRISGEVRYGHLSASALCRSFGPIYQQPPDGTRDMSPLYSRLTYHP